MFFKSKRKKGRKKRREKIHLIVTVHKVSILDFMLSFDPHTHLRKRMLSSPPFYK